MNFIIGLLVGLIVGWVIEWLIDWRFWRRDDEQVRKQLAEAQAKILELQQENEQLRASQTKDDEPKTKAPAPGSAPDAVTAKDPLEDITGIGPVFAKRLNEAGIYTFADLAALTPENIHEIIGPEDWQKIDPGVWIAEARQFMEEADKTKADKS